MGGGLHNASHLCCHRPGGAVHVEVLEAKVENPRRVNHDMARDLLTSYTAQENLESSSFSGDNLGWSNCSSQRIANMTCGDLYIISPCHCARLATTSLTNSHPGVSHVPKTAMLSRLSHCFHAFSSPQNALLAKRCMPQVFQCGVSRIQTTPTYFQNWLLVPKRAKTKKKESCWDGYVKST